MELFLGLGMLAVIVTFLWRLRKIELTLNVIQRHEVTHKYQAPGLDDEPAQETRPPRTVKPWKERRARGAVPEGEDQ